MQKKIAIIIPTYNERDALKHLLRRLKRQRKLFNNGNQSSIVIVDDTSPDGTAEVAASFSRHLSNLHILSGPKKGLGMAYRRGFRYALHELKADVIIQMDADGSHDIKEIPVLLDNITKGYSLVIGSRYIPGGSLPGDWSAFRVINSKTANFLARDIAGLASVQDCTSGFRAWDRKLLELLPLETMNGNGFAFQINTLAAALDCHATILEIPIHFQERISGHSKMRFFDMVEFVINSGQLGLRRLFPQNIRFKTQQFSLMGIAGIGMVTTGAGFWYMLQEQWQSAVPFGLAIFLLITLFMIAQNIFTLWGMMYSWDNPVTMPDHASPRYYVPPQLSFTAIVPALHEENVIAETIRTINAIDYPNHLKEIIVACRADDLGTIRTVRDVIAELGKDTIHVAIPPYRPKNKPDKLNYALEHSHHDIVCVFDAEDTPHADIYSIINTVMVTKHADVVQSGVQLMNFRSHWFATLNVLEYYFWFKSVLHYFAHKGTVLLGGNTVFFKRDWIEKVGGWDPECLTEDADIGIRLAAAGAKIEVIYEELHATKEETPTDILSFVRQRTRWNQGFLQVLKKQDWRRLPTRTQRFLMRYILIWPEIQVFIFLYSLAAIVMVFTLKLPILLALISFLPLYLLILYTVILIAGLREFTQKYHLQFPRWMPIKIILTFFPFQFLLGWSALRAVIRERQQKNGWEKTKHVNAHRTILAPKTS